LKLSLFQSLIGFKINWNKQIISTLRQFPWFQSLIGFKINWNNHPILSWDDDSWFQSLIGFKINWNELLSRIEALEASFNP